MKAVKTLIAATLLSVAGMGGVQASANAVAGTTSAHCETIGLVLFLDGSTGTYVRCYFFTDGSV